MKKIKWRKKKFIRKCKNGTVFCVDTWGDKWSNCEPFVIFYVKHNQYLINCNGSALKISSMNENGYEYSTMLFDDLEKYGYCEKYNGMYYRLKQEVEETYYNMMNYYG